MLPLLRHKPNWAETRERHRAWWQGRSLGRPMLNLSVLRDRPLPAEDGPLPGPEPWDYVGVDRAVRDFRRHTAARAWPAEAVPIMHLVPGLPLLAEYFGALPEFRPDTVWYMPVIPDGEPLEARISGDIAKHPRLVAQEAMLRRAAALSAGEFVVGIPDLMERMDTLAALRGSQECCYDLLDRPGEAHRACEAMDRAWETAYDLFYRAVRFPPDAEAGDGGSAWIAFGVWSEGRTAKLQCDFAAVMSPDQFREFALPGLRRQTEYVDTSFYHLDGKDAVVHLDAVLSLPRLGALQWTPGAGQPDGACERWWPIYRKARAAGKALWIYVSDGGRGEQIEAADRLVKAIGPEGLYLHFYGDFSEAEAADLVRHAETRWKCR